MHVLLAVAAGAVILAAGTVFVVGYRALRDDRGSAAALASLTADAPATIAPSADTGEYDNQRASGDYPVNPTEGNFTEEIASAVSGNLIAQATAGADATTALLNAPPEELVALLLPERGIDPSFVPALADDDLVITESVDRAAVTRYVTAFIALMRASAQRMAPLAATAAAVSSRNLAALIADAQETVDGLAALPVPKPLAAFHRRELELASGRLAIAEALAKASADPALAILAANAWKPVNTAFFDIMTNLADALPPGGLTP